MRFGHLSLLRVNMPDTCISSVLLELDIKGDTWGHRMRFDYRFR
jgi:hypothetical protein